MNRSIRHTAVAIGLAVAVLSTAGHATAASSTPVDAATVISRLQAEGYRVILDKVGAEPLSQCHVTSVRPGRPVTETVTAGGGDTVQRVLYTPIYVDVSP